MGGRWNAEVIAALLGCSSMLVMGACAKPVAPLPVAPEPSDSPVEQDDRKAFKMRRDPKGGYVTDDRPPPREPTPEPQPKPLNDPPPPDEQPHCTRKEFVVERCITGGAPRQGPHGLEGRTSCTTRCEPTPPTPHPSRHCRKIDARHYQCKSFAP